MLKLLIPVTSAIIAYYIRDTKNCKKNENVNVPIKKVISNGVIVQASATLINFVLQNVLPFLPVVGTAFRVMQGLPLIGNLFDYIMYILFYVIIYALTNMINGIDIKSYCSPTAQPKTDKIRLIVTIISAVVLILSTFAK
jgi:hypothetical protein